MADEIELGMWLLNIGPDDTVNPESFRRIATALDESEFTALCIGDHAAIPKEIPKTYPFSESGEPPIHYTDENYHPFTTLSYLAGITDDIRLATNVCVAPYYHPTHLVRQALSLYELSDGRFELGAGTGWLETEFDVLDIPFDERGGRTDEFFEILEGACAEGEVSYDGEYYAFDEVGFRPVPADGSTPHIWVGGGSGATIRRIGEFGDGWTTLWSSPDEVAAMRERIMNAWTDFDRTGTPEIALLRPSKVTTGNDPERDTLLVGSPESIVEDIRRYQDAGVTRLFITPQAPDVDEQAELISSYQSDVIPRL